MNAEFVKNLIKGKIAEIIFEQMFRESGKFTILHAGYEYTLPELAQYQHLAEVKAVIENISKVVQDLRFKPIYAAIAKDPKPTNFSMMCAG